MANDRIRLTCSCGSTVCLAKHSMCRWAACSEKVIEQWLDEHQDHAEQASEHETRWFHVGYESSGPICESLPSSDLSEERFELARAVMALFGLENEFDGQRIMFDKWHYAESMRRVLSLVEPILFPRARKEVSDG